MAFKLTYSDGQESEHDDDTAWDIDDGVLKLGRKDGEWSVYLSPSHWAVLELGGSSSSSGDSKGDKDSDDDEDEDASDTSKDAKKSKDSDDSDSDDSDSKKDD